MPANTFLAINRQAFVKNSVNLGLCNTNSTGVNINLNSKACEGGLVPLTGHIEYKKLALPCV